MFSLLRLDRVSRDEVLRNLTPIELFNLSQCSKTSLLNVKNLIRRTDKSCFLAISIAANCSVDIFDQKSNLEPKIKSSFIVHGNEQLGLQNENQSKSVINGFQFTGVTVEDGKKMETYWENEDLGFKALIEYIEDLYGKCARLFFDGDNTRKLFRIIDWSKNRPKPINHANLMLNFFFNDDQIVDILNYLAFVTQLKLIMYPSDAFIRNDHRAYEFNFVLFGGNNWFNLQRLLNTKCPLIKACRTSLTNADINLYINLWIKGFDFELKQLMLEVKDLKIPIILSGLPHTEVQPGRFDDVKIPLAFDIKRSDGRTARIFEMPPNSDIPMNTNINFTMWIHS